MVFVLYFYSNGATNHTILWIKRENILLFSGKRFPRKIIIPIFYSNKMHKSTDFHINAPTIDT